MEQSPEPLMSSPFLSSRMHVRPEWIDHNGHLNMAYYNVLFDLGSDEAFLALGMGPEYARRRGLTTYAAEVHIRYLRELLVDAPVTVTYQLIDHDEKRLHAWQEIRHADGWTAATCELLTLHVDRSGPKVAPFPPDVAARIERMAAAHAALPRPAMLGRPMGLRRSTA